MVVAMNNEPWSVDLAEETGRALRAYLARQGARGESVADFVDEAVRLRLFDLTVDEVKRRNTDEPEDAIFEAIDAAVTEGR